MNVTFCEFQAKGAFASDIAEALGINDTTVRNQGSAGKGVKGVFGSPLSILLTSSFHTVFMVPFCDRNDGKVKGATDLGSNDSKLWCR